MISNVDEIRALKQLYIILAGGFTRLFYIFKVDAFSQDLLDKRCQILAPITYFKNFGFDSAHSRKFQMPLSKIDIQSER